ncbi:MAG TPA: hypothetical protein VK897_17685 [Anaerolineales bacterium]|nr:hypothetical protein [Anaerolineales bacterium]
MRNVLSRYCLLLYSVVIALNLAFKPFPPEEACSYWVAPSPAGDNRNPGTIELPWATLEHAAAAVPDESCTVWFQDGTYTGDNRIKRRFETYTRFAAVDPYKVVLQHTGPVVSLTGASHFILDGFVFQHSGSAINPLVVQINRNDETWAEYIILRNNIFHDSSNSDLLKIYNGARFVSVTNNVFYNQGASEQHIDVNSVTDVTIQDNVFFNDFAASGRPVENNTKHYIVIKDSNQDDDGLLGSERITVQRNIFLNWQGNEGETFVQVGNDGNPYFEARQVTVQNNLFLGNSLYPIGAAFGVSGVKDVQFINNTVSGDLPSLAYAARVVIKDQNPKNENITFCNNIWSDPTGTMGMGTPEKRDRNEFSDGKVDSTINLLLDNNLYWNGGELIPPGDLLSPLLDDRHHLIADPELETDFTDLVLPVWDGTSFQSGNLTIRDEFLRLAHEYGSLPRHSPALLRGSSTCASGHDIFRFIRGVRPSFGADQGTSQISSMLSPFNLAGSE